ncbi:MAG: type II secretion system protein GspE, partial [Aeromonas sobria]
MSAYHLDGGVGPAPLPELPFAFARNFGVILMERAGLAILQCRPGVTPQALLEVRRVAGCAFTVEQL